MTLRKSCLMILAVAVVGLTAPMSSKASIITYFALLDGPSESPTNASPGIGTATITFDTVLFNVRVQAEYSGLLGNTTAAHIHCCTAAAGAGTAGVATQTPFFVGFPLGGTAGTYDHLYTQVTTFTDFWNAPFVTANGGLTGAFTGLLAGLDAGKAYFNVHSSAFPGGEIRGFLAPVPLPAALPLFTTGLGLLGLLGWRRKRQQKMNAAAA